MKLAIIGAGGHAKEVYQSLIASKTADSLAGFFVDNFYLNHESTLYDLPIKSIDHLDKNKHVIHIALGNIELRSKLFKKFQRNGFKFQNIIDPRSTLSSKIKEGIGVYIAQGAQVTVDVEIGNAVIINTGVIVSHDCTILEFCNISPGSILCGNVKIGEKTFIGAGSIIREEIVIANNVVIGLGSKVFKNILYSGTYIFDSISMKKIS